MMVHVEDSRQKASFVQALALFSCKLFTLVPSWHFKAQGLGLDIQSSPRSIETSTVPVLNIPLISDGFLFVNGILYLLLAEGSVVRGNMGPIFPIQSQLKEFQILYPPRWRCFSNQIVFSLEVPFVRTILIHNA